MYRKQTGSPDHTIAKIVTVPPSSVGMVAVVMTYIDSGESSAEDVPEMDHCPPMARASIANVASRIEEYSSLEYGYLSEI
jgi:hypothetical protein